MKFSQQAMTVVAVCFLSWSISTDAFSQIQNTRHVKPLQYRNMHGIYSGNTELHAMPIDFSGAMETASSTTTAITSSPLFEYFLQTVISYAVPTFFAIVTIFFASSAFKKDKSEYDDDESFSGSAVSELYSDLYGDSSKKSMMPDFSFGQPKKSSANKNLGIPSQEYIKITSINERYDAYDYSIAAATKSKAAAAAGYRSKSFDRALQLALEGDSPLPSYAKAKLLDAEKKFLKKGKKLVKGIQLFEKILTSEAIDVEFDKLGIEKFKLDPEPVAEEKAVDESGMEGEVVENEQSIEAVDGNATASANKTATTEKKTPNKSSSMQAISKLQRELKQCELEFIQDVVSAVGAERAYALRAAIMGDIAGRGGGGLLMSLEDRPLSAVLNGMTSDQKSLFVMNFPGDVTASQLNGLREEVTAVIRNGKPGDEVLVVLQSGGGTVTGYGLAAGQLVRLKEKGIFLTIAVEQVAASGGYMMTCVADKIVASPFAVLGSIGVISEIPNFYNRLKEEGIEYQTITAGKFKRTITPTKQVTKEDKVKAKEDIEMILSQFSGFVKENRPTLDIESVATGETWFGTAAMEKGLCDEIGTVDDVLLKHVDDGYKVYDVKYSPPPKVPDGLAGFFAESNPNLEASPVRNTIRWLVRSVAEEIVSLPGTSAEATNRYMAKDDTADRTRL